MNFLKLLFYLLFFIFNPWSLAFSSESPYVETNIPKQELHLVILDQDDFNKQQELDNKVSFLSAVKRATQSLLSDYDEGNETPLDIVYERAYEQSSNDLQFIVDAENHLQIDLPPKVLRGRSSASKPDPSAQ